ncbi:tol-pal system protein YbgF [Phaeobacter sp.]|uniref:tol-pal system protein YbgF n=1 Tax=Phaeobacter sp. TaxID=1902409 RepID=UPI0025CE2596|nr:tol-pal system protein YbgF [Phaeobacter sp.]
MKFSSKALWIALGLVAALALSPVRAQAQTPDQQTLADIRQELTLLYVDIQRLKRELSTTGSPQANLGGNSVLDRVGAIEAELQRLTAQTEQLSFRVDRVVQDGTNRIGDLEFRLVELEGGDISQLGETTTLGAADLPGTASGETQTGGTQAETGLAGNGQVVDGQAGDGQAGNGTVAGADTAAATNPAAGGGTANSGLATLPTDQELAVAEQRDFDAAKEAFEAGSFQAAADQFIAFTLAYPGSPLTPAAEFNRGKSLDGLGDTREAARAYLAAFSASPSGQTAPDALVALGAALGRLGQTSQACVTLAEVSSRFPSSAAVSAAQIERSKLACS